MARNYISIFGGKRIGWVDEDSLGNKSVFNAAGLIVSKYNKNADITTDFFGRMITKGDTATGFLLRGLNIPGFNT